MKKIVLSLLMVVVVLVGTFADPAIWVSDGVTYVLGPYGQQSAITPVWLSTQSTLQAEVGFTREPVTADHYNLFLTLLNESKLNPIDATTGIELSVNRESGVASNNSIYATWLIQSGSPIDIYLVADGKLKRSGGSGEIGWTVTSGENEFINCMGLNRVGISQTAIAAPTNKSYLFQHDPSEYFKHYGSRILNISTEEVWYKPAGYYSANLYLVIKSAS